MNEYQSSLWLHLCLFQIERNKAAHNDGSKENTPFAMSNEMADEVKKSGIMEFHKIEIGYNNDDFMRNLMSCRIGIEEGIAQMRISCTEENNVITYSIKS